MWTSIFLTVALSLALLAGQQNAVDDDAIRQLNRDFAAAMNAGDVDALVTMMTDDVVMMPPGAAPVHGAEAVRRTFDEMFEQVVLHETWTSVEVVVDGEHAYDWSRYNVRITARESGESVEEKGQNLFVARREAEGAWKYARLMWNTDHPQSGR